MKKIVLLFILIHLLFGEEIGALIASKFKTENNSINILKKTIILKKTTISSVSVNDEIVGFYKLISSSGNSNGTPFSFDEAALNGSIMSISKDGFISQIIILNGSFFNYSIGYITNVTDNKVNIFNINLGLASNLTYTFNNNILTTYFNSFNVTEIDKWEKIYDVSSNTSDFNSNINVNTNWQLFGALKDIDDMSIFNNSCVLYIWKYENNTWKIYVPNATQSVKNILNTLNISTIKSIKKGTGFWIIGNTNCLIKY